MMKETVINNLMQAVKGGKLLVYAEKFNVYRIFT